MWRPVSDYAERQLEAFLYPGPAAKELFTSPPGEEALVPAEGINAEVYSVPLTVYIGGIAAVILELAEPRVRHGVWDHSIFPQDPVTRLKRTGLAAMVTIYGARSRALSMIEGINLRHGRVEGTTRCGQPYQAWDPELLTWVQATAAFGFLSAYSAYAARLSEDEWSQALGEAEASAKAYGVPNPPRSFTALKRLIDETAPRLEPSETLHEFLKLMRETPTLPPPGAALQPLFVRAAVSVVPPAIGEALELAGYGLRFGERELVKLLVRGSRFVRLRNHPRALAAGRMAQDPAG